MSKHHKTAVFFIGLLLALAGLRFFMAIGFWYFVLVLLIWIGVIIWGSAFVDSNYHVKAYCNNPAETEKKIAITFDDGPHPITLQVLDLLKQYDAPATFFCIGKNIESHPEILRRTFAEGHLIGNHSYSHSASFDWYGPQKVAAELQQTDWLIEKAIGKKPNWFRPPYGVTNPSIGKALLQTGHRVIGWNIRSLDGKLKDENAIFNRIEKRISPGGIILLHDTSEHSVNVLERLLLALRDKKYKVVPLEQLLNIKAYEV